MGFVVEAYNVDGTAATVLVETAAQTYLDLNTATSNQVRMVSIADHTIILNTTVKAGTKASTEYDIETVHTDYDVMASHNPVALTYHSTTDDTTGNPEGFWQFTEKDNGFAKWVGREMGEYWSEANGHWDSKSKNPMGFKITFDTGGGAMGFAASGAGTPAVNQNYTQQSGTENGRPFYQGVTDSTFYVYFNNIYGAWEIGTALGNQSNPDGPPGTFTYYFIYSGAGTPPLTGWSTSGNVGTEPAPVFGATTNTGRYEVIENFFEKPETTMAGVALRLQRKLQAAGARNALIYWEATAANKGRMVIISPYRGTNASIDSITPPDPVSGLTGAKAWDLSGLTTSDKRVFEFDEGIASDGTGTVTTQSEVIDRWTRVAPPGQPGAELDETTMPVKMVRRLAYTAAGAGTSNVNQVYKANKFQNGETAYKGETTTTLWLYWNSTHRAWEISSDETNLAEPQANTHYYVYSSDETPPLSGWILGANGTTTVPKLTGAATPTVFEIRQPTWGFRPNGNDDTNPKPSIWEDRTAIKDIVFHRNRMVLAGDESIVFSRAGDFFEFYLEDHDNITDADPIDIELSSDQVTLIDYMVPFRQTLVIFTQAGRQFELNAPDILTPTSAAVTSSTSYEAVTDVRPQQSGSMLYFGAQRKDAAQLMEYFYDDSRVSNFAADVTSHAEELLPITLRTIQTSPNNSVVLVLPNHGADLYVYRSFWQGQEKDQSAWAKWTFTGYDIEDIAIIDNDCYLLVDDEAAGFIIEKVPLVRQSAKDAANDAPFLYTVHLDRQHEILGNHSGGTTTWTLPDSYTDTTIDTIVAGPDFDISENESLVDSGAVITSGVTANGTTVTLAGNYADGECILGTAFTMSVQLSRQYVRDREDKAIVAGRSQVLRITANHKDSMAYDIRANMRGRSVDRTKSLNEAAISDGELKAYFSGNAKDLKLFIENTTPKPSTISEVEIVIDHSDRRPS